MRRSVSTAGLAAALVLGMGALGAGPKSFEASAQQKPATMEVKIDNFSFGPVELMVPTVASPFAMPFTLQTMVFVDPATLGINCRLVPSRTVVEDGESKAGTFPYFCSIHPKMTGKVIAQ